jgi:hypothetical protein
LRPVTEIFFDRQTGEARDGLYLLLFVILTHAFYYKLLIPGQMIFGTDLQNQSYPVQIAMMREIYANGYVPQWNPFMNAGMPLLASFSFHIIYPGTWIFFFVPTYFAMGYLFVMHTTLMGIFFYLYAREIGLRRGSSFIGGLLFCFALHYISLVYPAHGGKIITITFLPLALLFIERAFKSDALMNFMGVGLIVGLMFHGGHPQILFYCGIAMSVYFLFRAVAGWKKAGMKATLRLFGLYAAAFAVGTLLYAVILLPAWEYKGYTHRGGGVAGTSDYKFATSFSQPPEDMLYVPLRNPFGWGKQYGPEVPTTSDIFYRGRIGLRLSIDYFPVFGLVLALLGALFVRGVHKWIFVALAGLTCFLALGGFNPLYEYVHKYVPGFSFFRIPYAIMILLPMSLSALAALGFEFLLDNPGALSKRSFSYFVYGLAGVIGVTLLIAVYWSVDMKGAVQRILEMQWVREMLWGQYADVYERLGFFIENLAWFVGLMTISLVLVVLYRKGLLKPKPLFLATAIFILADSWSLGWDFIHTVPYDTIDEVFYKKTEPLNIMVEDNEDNEGGKFRVFALTQERQLMYYGLESATGYHPVILEYFEKLVRGTAFNNQVLQLLNVHYLMTPKDKNYDFRNTGLMERFDLAYEDADTFLYKLKDPPPRAYLVTKLIAVDDYEQAFGIATNPRFESRNTAVILRADVDRAAVEPGADVSAGGAKYTSFEPDRFTIEVDAPADSLMVVSEIWYPGWKAYVDGVDTDIIRTNYALRGVPIKKGGHTVEMEFDPGLFTLGMLLSALALIFILGLFGYKYYTMKTHKSVEEK